MPKSPTADELIKYSTGFYGSKDSSSEAVISPFIEERVARLQYDSSIFNRNPKKTITLNRTVNELYAAYMVDQAIFLRRFDNREAIILNALKCFGFSVSHWYMKHIKDKDTDQRLIDFIEDTSRYILTGERKYPIGSWQRILETKKGPHLYTEIQPYTAQLMRVVTHNRPLTEFRHTTEVVQMWLTNPAGIIDMLLSLNIMFGPIKFQS